MLARRSWGRLLGLPEAMPGLGDEHVLERRLAERDRRDAAGKRFHDPRDPLVPFRLLKPHAAIYHGRPHTEPRGEIDRERCGVVGLDGDRIAADSAAQHVRRIERDKLAAM